MRGARWTPGRRRMAGWWSPRMPAAGWPSSVDRPCVRPPVPPVMLVYNASMSGAGRGGSVTFFERLEQSARRTGSRLCVGLDPDPRRIAGTDIAGFLREIVAATRDVACCYKPNLAFFEAFGEEGWSVLRRTLDGIPDGVPVIADAKRGDIGSTAAAYARALFERWDFDAATVNAYGGEDTVRPFLDYGDRGVYVWCRSSNPGAADLQDLPVADGSGGMRPLFEVLAERVRA